MELLKNYINGRWEEAGDVRRIDVENPSTGEIITQVPLSGKSQVDAAVRAARAAFPEWSRTPVARRVSFLFQLRELLRKREDEIVRTLVSENGKSLPDALAEMKRNYENIEVACGMPVMQQGDKAVGCSYGIDGEVLRLPVGVFGMIAPFNFPAMVPFWFLPYALAAGNTFVLKMSEQTPCTFSRIAEYIHESGLPVGVFNMVHGDREAAEALGAHPEVDGIAFVGSSRVARIVSETCAREAKRCIAMGSAKNHLVAMSDANVDEMIRNMITSCYGCAGQRCMASSVLVGVGRETYETIRERFVRASKDVIVANPLDPRVADEAMVMGPVISAAARERILRLIESGLKEGAELALDGCGLSVPGCEKGHFLGPCVFADVKPSMEIYRTEIFGPVVCIMRVESLDDAIRLINEHAYGNGASIYTRSGYYARKFKLECRCGMIGINVGIPAPVAHLPFGGMKQSLFSPIKAQGKAVVDFFTEQKIVTERYWSED